MQRVAIVGAGIAGATLARRLIDAGMSVDVFEKSRGTGGRLAAARFGEASLDLGAPIIEAHSADFNAWLAALASKGHALRWPAKVQQGLNGSSAMQNHWLGVGRNSALTRALLEGVTLHTEKRVGVLWSDASGALLRDEHGELLGYFDAVVSAAPAPQAEPLLEVVSRFAKRAHASTTTASWVALFQLARLPKALADFDIVNLVDSPIGRIVVESHKPGRSGALLHVELSQVWSEQCIDEDRDAVLADVQKLLEESVNESLEIEQVRLHRWLYSRSQSAGKGELALWDSEMQVGACGDWIGAPGIEGAWVSANALADMILAS
jgi:renalase